MSNAYQHRRVALPTTKRYCRYTCEVCSTMYHWSIAQKHSSYCSVACEAAAKQAAVKVAAEPSTPAL
jgi:hypothetical protein